MKNLQSTYRLQFNRDFTFKDFEKVKLYFKKLGVKTIYASPIFGAVPGSTHGYDVCQPNAVNQEIGNEMQLLDLSRWLKENGMFWLQDMVPNHMAFHPKNTLLMDLLEKGTHSLFANYFDTVFACPEMKGKLMVPFLGQPLEKELDLGKLKIRWTGKRLALCIDKMCFPLKPSSYLFFLEKLNLKKLVQEISLLENLASKEEYFKKWDQILSWIGEAFGNLKTSFELQHLLEGSNENKKLLRQIILEQYYELCQWSETDKRINYRRFFIVNGLICLNMSDKKVFEEHHLLIKKMVEDEVFDGLRIDHIDGLFEPTNYLKRLRNLVGRETYIVAEKILEKGEEMPASWPIQGNTGYDFLGMVNNLFTKKSSERIFDDFYKEVYSGKLMEEEELKKKQYILENHLAGELENLYMLFKKLKLGEDPLDKDNLKSAIASLLVNMPVYRFYGESFPLNEAEKNALANVFNKIKEDNILFRKEIEKLEEILLKTSADKNNIQNKAAAYFFKRCMQFSGPIMAKGVEDTLMYTHFRFIGHNEVGDHPSSFGLSIDEFHHLMADRQKQHPLSMNTTSTHDTKRGEDARARLNVLTALPQKWLSKVQHWQRMNAQRREKLAIGLHEEYFIYQCLLAHYPMVEEEQDGFGRRLKNYLQKAFREGKQHSDWSNVDKNFEAHIAQYVDFLLEPESEFLEDFKAYHAQIAFLGALNSLAQLGLKFTCPGIPDVYQGGELWDFSFVDPDNRQKVDYDMRFQGLEELDFLSIEDLMMDYRSGKIKLWLTHQLFELRKNEASVFSHGDYFPVQITGKYKNNIIAFIRKIQHQSLLVVSVIDVAEVWANQERTFADLDWKDTEIILPEQSNWFNLFQKNEGNGKVLKLNDFCLKIPFAVCKLSGESSRSAGILMHLSALPSAFGIGDLGPAAFRFVDFLERSGQRYWQLLPIGPGASPQDISPYSTLCSRATNPMFISPEILKQDGLLEESDLADVREIPSEKIDYEKVKELKSQLLKKAFINDRMKLAHDELFQEFIASEKDWLEDYALFLVIRNKFNQPWLMWPDEYKFRKNETLQTFSEDHHQEILEQKWYQYVFQKQWDNLKSYCSQHQIHLIGDLPFYVNHDSSDVWAHQSLFSLNDDGSIDKMAGVPPDYFSAEGQLWGMPVYRWDEMKKENYKWWLSRIHKNLLWFNLLRLDHFRAFYNYWEVTATEENAINGKWRLGPATDFLNQVKIVFERMPFIAEDLGDVSKEIFELRDEFGLPGMKVLQFAFGEDMPVSTHIPHQHSTNFIVYTGTHDNNTTKGWFRRELLTKDKERLNAYLGKQIEEDSVAEALVNMAYSSVGKVAIIPIQDILNLDERHRTNIPGTSSDNWSFRIEEGKINDALAHQLKQSVIRNGR